MIQKALSTVCKHLGHNWMYKDYTNWIKENGEKYYFKASRNCKRCNQHEYLHATWEPETQKSPHDLENDFYALKQIVSAQPE